MSAGSDPIEGPVAMFEQAALIREQIIAARNSIDAAVEVVARLESQLAGFIVEAADAEPATDWPEIEDHLAAERSAEELNGPDGLGH